jgi:hypothetical protein
MTDIVQSTVFFVIYSDTSCNSPRGLQTKVSRMSFAEIISHAAKELNKTGGTLEDLAGVKWIEDANGDLRAERSLTDDEFLECCAEKLGYDGRLFLHFPVDAAGAVDFIGMAAYYLVDDFACEEVLKFGFIKDCTLPLSEKLFQLLANPQDKKIYVKSETEPRFSFGFDNMEEYDCMHSAALRLGFLVPEDLRFEYGHGDDADLFKASEIDSKNINLWFDFVEKENLTRKSNLLEMMRISNIGLSDLVHYIKTNNKTALLGSALISVLIKFLDMNSDLLRRQ